MENTSAARLGFDAFHTCGSSFTYLLDAVAFGERIALLVGCDSFVISGRNFLGFHHHKTIYINQTVHTY